MVSFCDIFDINYNDINVETQDIVSKYYLFGRKISKIVNSKNGLITI